MSGWRLSPKAEDDLFEIVLYVERESGSEATADRLAEEFFGAFDRIAESPKIGSVRSFLPGLRVWLVRDYLIMYEDARPVRVVRVIHGARNVRTLMRDE